MGMEGPALGFEADGLANAFDLGGERGHGPLWLYTRPQGAGVTLLEPTDAGEAEFEGRRGDTAQGVGEVVRYRRLNLAHEAQCQVQLPVRPPAEVRAVVHSGEAE